jgi:membrane associated rhomboid family serine protease
MQSFHMRGGNVYILGGRFPAQPFGLAMAIVVCSILGAVLTRNGAPLYNAVLFAPALVWHGQIWRLFTWIFFDDSPLGLIFDVLIVLFFGRDLQYAWGPRRFLGIFLLIPATAAFLTTLAAPMLWSGARNAAYLGPGALLCALTVAWATLFPSRQILVYFVLPLGGRVLIYATVGILVIFALYSGLDAFIPHFLAVGLMFLYLRGLSLDRFGSLFKRRSGGSRRPSHLRPVERGERKEWLH